jgi:hypothetical protein
MLKLILSLGLISLLATGCSPCSQQPADTGCCQQPVDTGSSQSDSEVYEEAENEEDAELVLAVEISIPGVVQDDSHRRGES